MAVYLIGYDLNKSGKDYDGLYEAIKSYGTWWHHLDSTWMIDTNDSCKSVYEKLQPHIDSDDRIIIIEVKNNYYGYLKKEAWEWLKKRFNSDIY